MSYVWIVNICTGIGIILIFRFTYIFILSKKSKDWKKTEGEIVNSKVQKTNDDGVIYKAVIRYKYTIGEKVYFSNRVFYGDNTWSNFSKSAKTLVNKYPKGEKALVYYNPKHPNQSVLETGVHSVIYWVLFGGVLLLFISAVMLTKESFVISLFY